MGEATHAAHYGRPGVGVFVNPDTATLVEYNLADDLARKQTKAPLLASKYTCRCADFRHQGKRSVAGGVRY